MALLNQQLLDRQEDQAVSGTKASRSTFKGVTPSAITALFSKGRAK
jgi:hypothetical protein